LEIEEAILETVRINKFKEGYIRPIVFLGEGDMGPLSKNNPVQTAIIIWPWGHYLGKEALDNGISVKISKWRRDNRVMPFYAKIGGNYVNAALAKREAEEAGCKEALIEDQYGHIVEGSAENIFMAKDGKLYTPSLTEPILKGITRSTAIHLAASIGLAVEETFISPELFFDADEAFFTGTAAEITPIKEAVKEGENTEKLPIGKVCPGPITKKIQELYFNAVRGEIPEYQKEWLTYV
jgi:branched-chain amino acid aminotransferase